MILSLQPQLPQVEITAVAIKHWLGNSHPTAFMDVRGLKVGIFWGNLFAHQPQAGSREQGVCTHRR